MWSDFQSCLPSLRYNGESVNQHWNQIILEILLSSDILVSNVSSWDWCLIDCTINLILWDKPPSSCYRWVAKVEQPSITGQLHLHFLRSWRKAQSVLCSLWLLRNREGHIPGPSPFLPGQGWHGPGLAERLFHILALATCAGHLCYEIPPSLWSGTYLSQPGLAKLL